MANISLTEEMRSEIQRLVDSGEYASASEVLREGFRLLKERRERGLMYDEWLRAQIELGWRDYEAGRIEPHDMDAVIEDALADPERR